MGIKKLYSCSCTCEGLILDYDKKDKELCISFWAVGPKFNANTLGWRERLRWIWNVIKTGSPYTDMVILTEETARLMAKDILNNIEE